MERLGRQRRIRRKKKGITFLLLLVKMETGMIGYDLKEETSSMVNNSPRDAKQMISERFKTNRPPGRRQRFPLHHGEDIVGEGIESPPSGIGKESFRWHHPSGEIIFEDIMDFFYRSTAFSLPPEQSLSVPTPDIGDDGKVMIGRPILKEFSLSRSDTNRQVPIGFHPFFSRRLAGNKLDLGLLLSPNDQPLIGHLSQRLPNFFRKSLNRCSKLLCHIRTDGKLDAGSSGDLLSAPVQQFMDVGCAIRTNPHQTNRGRQGQNGLPGLLLLGRLMNQILLNGCQPLQSFRLLRNKGLMRKTPLKEFFFMKGVEKAPHCFRRGNLKSQLLQPLILSQYLKIIDTISTGSKNRNEGLYIIGLPILALSLKKRKMSLNGFRKSQRPKGLHDQRKTTERGEKNLRCILN